MANKKESPAEIRRRQEEDERVYDQRAKQFTETLQQQREETEEIDLAQKERAVARDKESDERKRRVAAFKAEIKAVTTNFSQAAQAVREVYTQENFSEGLEQVNTICDTFQTRLDRQIAALSNPSAFSSDRAGSIGEDAEPEFSPIRRKLKRLLETVEAASRPPQVMEATRKFYDSATQFEDVWKQFTASYGNSGFSGEHLSFFGPMLSRAEALEVAMPIQQMLWTLRPDYAPRNDVNLGN